MISDSNFICIFFMLGLYLTPNILLWQGAFPISSLFSSGLKFPAESADILKLYRNFPYLACYRPEATLDGGSRRIYLEFSLG